MDKNRFGDRLADENASGLGSKRGLEGAHGIRLALACVTAAVLFIIAAIAFFAFREDEGTPSKLGSGAKAEPTELPSARNTGGHRADIFDSGTVVMGVDIGGSNEYEAKRRLSGEVERMMNEYECALRHGDRHFVLKKDDITLESDLDEVLTKALINGKGEYSVELRPADDRRLKAAVDAIAEDIDRPPRDAELLSTTAAEGLDANELERNSRFIVTAPIDGARLDREETARIILAGVREADLSVNAVNASAEAPVLPVRRAVFSTSYNSASLSASGRVHNIKKGAALMNARSLEPGESLSCNEVLGERTKENGWQTGTAFASGGKKTEQQYGGGICQISTTLYNCALMAGLEATERIGHSRKVAYIEGGRDAALSWGSADLVIKNSTNETVYIFMWTDNEKKCLSCEIYGGAFPEEYDEIAIISELVEVTEPSEPEFIIDDSLKDGECVRIRDAIRGRVYQTYAEYRKNGAAVRREEIARTPYQMIPALYAVPKPKE